ncbi:hypothetical protein [Paraburkholderia sartisoli]|uniref:Uncharacterized protein n=1 Tax=Paraburkholderia sartisoli TaxID=83784 RepID=A0A1H4CGY5_9BURK|nr:hypothetical protein [Paraburkholderia sartisoli]SEA59671.1 hypothetical protein SAMN05192564_102307 [Paraburkholderia sartisoli]
MPPIDRFASGKLMGGSCKTLALQALAGTEPVSVVAERSGASRPTVYRQMNRANGALDALFTPAASADDEVPFTLPVTRPWLEQVALGLMLIGHTLFRGVIEFIHDLLGVPLSLGTVHNIHQRAARQRHSPERRDRSLIRAGRSAR